MTYDVHDHPMLSPRAKALLEENEDQFDSHHKTAEVLLELESTSFSGTSADTAKLAIAHQINFQVESGLAPHILFSSTNAARGGDVVTYRGYRSFPTIHPVARKLRDALVRGTRQPMTSLRSR